MTPETMRTSKPHAIIIGAGFTGVATAHDLALRGFSVTVVERGPIINGTSGRTHGLLHSGARYVEHDKESAIECIEENRILRKITPQCIEPNGGLFIGLNDSDLAYAEAFEAGCEACGIEIQKLSPQQALKLEPNLNPKVIIAYTVPDGTFDPLRLALGFAASAKKNGARFRLYTEVKGMLLDGKGNVIGVKIWDRTADKEGEIHADIVVNATGAWAGELAALANVTVPVTPTPGVMLAFDQRLAQRAINRLNRPGDGDIVLPQRRMLVIGTTSFSHENLDYIPVYEDQVELMRKRAIELVPGLATAKERGAWMASRPLVGKADSGRSIARTFKCFDHMESHGVDGLVTITGGKATTLRVMAEKTADVVCQKLGINDKCQTSEIPLAHYREYYAIPD